MTFNLWFYYDVSPEHTGRIAKEDLVRQVQYTPLELDKISPAFAEKLDFLGAQFTFSEAQTSVFLKTLNDNLGTEEIAEEAGMTDEEAEVSVQR